MSIVDLLAPFLKGRVIKAPGAKGGKGYHTKKGTWRYGQKSVGKTRSGKDIPHAGHAAYDERHKLPKWNSQPAVREEAGAMRRSPAFQGWSKEDHLDAAAAHAKHRDTHKAAHGKLYKEAEAAHGRKGPEISGVGQEHWPDDVKDRLRAHATASARAGSASHTHYKMAGKRTHYTQSEFAAQ